MIKKQGGLCSATGLLTAKKAKKEEEEKKRKQEKETDRLEINPIGKVFCTACGDGIFPENLSERKSVRKCGQCIVCKTKSAEIKYCKYCGKSYAFDEHRQQLERDEYYRELDEKERDLMLKRSWASRAICPNCKNSIFSATIKKE